MLKTFGRKFSFVLPMLLLVACGQIVNPGGEVKDKVFFGPVFDPDNVLTDYSEVLATLYWPTEEQAEDRSHINIKDFDPWRDLSHLQSYSENAPSPENFCFQLIRSSGSKIVTYHNAKCPENPKQILPKSSLYFWLTVDANGTDLYYKGYHVGKLLKKTVAGVKLHYVNDLCTYHNYKTLEGSQSICDVYIFGRQFVGINIIEKLRSPPVQLKGFNFKKTIPTRNKEVVAATCPEPIFDGKLRGCTAIGSAVSDACSKAGFDMLPCGDCEHICSANFQSAENKGGK